MNWSRAKTILIIFFICTNIFLLFILLFFMDSTPRVSEEIVASTVQILKANGIDADEKLLMQKNEPVYIPEAENIVKNRKEFAENLLGSETKEESDDFYSGSKGTVLFDGDRFEFLPVSGFMKSEIKSSYAQNSSGLQANIVSLLGIFDTDLVFKTKEENGVYFLNISRKKGNMQYFCCSADVEYSNEGIKKISGTWFREKGRKQQLAEQKPITGLMIDYIGAKENTEEKKTVADIVSGYYIPEDGKYHEKIFLTPCIGLFFTDGQMYYINSTEQSLY